MSFIGRVALKAWNSSGVCLQWRFLHLYDDKETIEPIFDVACHFNSVYTTDTVLCSPLTLVRSLCIPFICKVQNMD